MRANRWITGMSSISSVLDESVATRLRSRAVGVSPGLRGRGAGGWWGGVIHVMTKGAESKAQLRTTYLRRLNQQEEDARRRKSATIWRKVSRLTAFRQATMVFCYVALPYEVQTWQMIRAMLRQGKRVAVPLVRRGSKRLRVSEVRDPAAELVPGAFGVLEPAPSARRAVRVREIDLVIVPGLAFDARGHRLGHGYGYFDRFLARLPKTTPTVGLAYRFQLLDRLPAAAHDHAVKTVLTA